MGLSEEGDVGIGIGVDGELDCSGEKGGFVGIGECSEDDDTIGEGPCTLNSTVGGIKLARVVEVGETTEDGGKVEIGGVVFGDVQKGKTIS